jgi:ferric-dicitrate binding protein FerR (iron transport regulator)
MSTPRGGNYQLNLSDGTKVWLNSSSTIKYPLVFQENERRVILTGEAYFEVAKNQSKPFYVETENMTIHVLGTHFNVNAYKDEPSTKTTLLEGKVSVKLNNNKSALLKPGQQAETDMSLPGNIKVNNDIDLYSVTAWQRGLFEFRNADLSTIARQLSRWYNIDIEVSANMKAFKLGGGILKNAPFSGVLKMLQANNIKYTWKGKTITLESF